eukprot:UN13392
MQKEDDYRRVAHQRDLLANEARKTVGLFSEYGVNDCRKQFWHSWERGKAVAKRMSWWDAILLELEAPEEMKMGSLRLLNYR